VDGGLIFFLWLDWLAAPLDPIGEGVAMEAVAEAAGAECIIPGQQAPLRLMGLKV
jgi:hypothetical protein